jgi:putative membrane protein
VIEGQGRPPEEWRRTHPAGFLVKAIGSLRSVALPLAAVLYGSRSHWQDGPLLLVPIVAAVLAVSAAFSYWGWRQLRYRVGEGDIRVERGILSRSARSVPYDRIQDVSLEQALLPRLFGLVEVRFETGAGGQDELKLAFVDEAQGAALRDTVRARRQDQASPGTPAAPGAAGVAELPSRTLFAMDNRRLVLFGVFEFSLVVFAVLAGASQQFEFLLPYDLWSFDWWDAAVAGPGQDLAQLGPAVQLAGVALALGLLAVVGLVTGLGRTVLRDYGFLLEETVRGLRRRRGLLTRTDMIMPIPRVQALKLTTGIIRRRFGWHGLEVISLAQDAKSGSQVLVPFAREDEIAPVVDATGLALPAAGSEWRRASRRHYVDRATIVVVPLVGLAALTLGSSPALGPAAAGLAALFGALAVLALFRQLYRWWHDSHALTPELLFVRRGWLTPTLDIAPRIKLQSVELVQGPLARRRGYADLRFGLAGGRLELRGLALQEARIIRAAVLDSIVAVDFSELRVLGDPARLTLR